MAPILYTYIWISKKKKSILLQADISLLQKNKIADMVELDSTSSPLMLLC